jgi:hypothetical protein
MAHAMRHQEYHITVTGDPFAWVRTCHELNIKPLWIELNNFERQLMCAIKLTREWEWTAEAWAACIEAHGFTVVRIKDEIAPYKLDVTCHGDDDGKRWLEVPSRDKAIYYECHAKFDGPFRPAWHMSSRDLLRPERWYATNRSEKPFDAKAWVEMVTQWAAMPDGWRGPSTLAGWEYEAAVLDTNPNLDAHWSAFTH